MIVRLEIEGKDILFSHVDILTNNDRDRPVLKPIEVLLSPVDIEDEAL